jgi:hypothetical protein
MGTTIEIMTEKQNDSGEWVCVDDYIYDDIGDVEIPNPVFSNYKMFYAMFAVLANVNNRFGLVPISEPRGVPNNVSAICQEWLSNYEGMGFSHSYHTLQQMLDHTQREPLTELIDELYRRYGTDVNPDKIRIVFFFN